MKKLVLTSSEFHRGYCRDLTQFITVVVLKCISRLSKGKERKRT